MTLTTRKMAFTAVMTVVICICSWLTIPFTVPFTMQTFAVFCALLLLGGKTGILSIGLYILMGMIGLPVFSGFRGGIGHILAPTGGYIVGFLFMGLFYLLFEGILKKRPGLCFPVLLGGLFICYLIGTLWFGMVYSAKGTEYSFLKILGLCVFPYLIPDVVKLLLALFVSKRLKNVLKL